MINTLTRAATLGALLATTIFATAAPASAQAPSQAQRDAIKSQCRSDYMAHCSSIPPGGEASLQCLQKNMSSLAPGCQSAVRAVEAPATAPRLLLLRLRLLRHRRASKQTQPGSSCDSHPRNPSCTERPGSLLVCSHNDGLGCLARPGQMYCTYRHDQIFLLSPSVLVSESSRSSR